MLVVHPASTCDICLDTYNWSAPAKVPHAIQCGHIFCYDCLRSTHPSNCPLCRKGFNPERIKKLHVDRPSTPRMEEESEFLRQIGLLFAEDAADEDINRLVSEVEHWLGVHEDSTNDALRNAIHALHQYRAMQAQAAVDQNTIESLRQNHARHAHVKQQDLNIAMIVESNIISERDREREAFNVSDYVPQIAKLREQNARMQMELDRYTSMPNPLPRPPEIVPLVTNLTRDHSASSVHSSQHGVTSLGLGPAPTQAQSSAPDRATAPTAQSRSSSGGSRARAPSVHFAGSASTGHHQAIDGEVLREEPAKHRHFIVPDITPRAPITAVQHPPQVLSSRHINWPPHLQEYAPQPGKPCVWLGPPGVPHEVLPNEVPLESLYTPARAGPSSQPPLDNSDIPPVIPSPPVPPTMTARAATETGSTRLRVDPPEGPLSGRSPMAWRPVPAHQEGSVMVYLPEIGITWLPEDQAARLPVRARGTVCRFAYVIAKEPSEVDDERRRAGDGASPPSINPLQLSGVPQAPVAGPSTSVVQRGGYGPMPGPSTAVSTLFLNSERTGNASASSSSSSLSGLGLLAPASSNSRSTRTQSSRNTGDPLGLNLASFPEPGRSATQRSQEDSEAERSPASSWGTLPSMPSRHSSLGNLHLNNLPNPQPFARSTDSLDQLPIGELNGGPIVLTDAVTPRQGSLLFGDDRSVASGRSEPSRSRRGEPSGLLLNPSAGSSRQVVSSIQDLEGVNRSLMQLADSQDARDPEPRRGSRPSTRHSRQPSTTGDERDAMVGLRTGLALYSSRPVAQQPSNYSSGSPSSDEPPSSAQSRPRSGASTRSHAESAYSSYSHRSSHSHHSSQSMQSNQSVHSGGSHRSSDASRPRRSSTVSALDGVRERNAYETPSWTTTPADTQSYHSSRDAHSSDSRSRKSQESIPRAMEGLGSGPASMSSLLLSFDPPSTSSAVTESGEEAAGIHAPRPVNGRRSSLFGGAWNARSGR